MNPENMPGGNEVDKQINLKNIKIVLKWFQKVLNLDEKMQSLDMMPRLSMGNSTNGMKMIFLFPKA